MHRWSLSPAWILGGVGGHTPHILAEISFSMRGQTKISNLYASYVIMCVYNLVYMYAKSLGCKLGFSL